MRFGKPHKAKFLILFSCILVTTFSGAFYPYIFGLLVDEVFYNKDMSVFIDLIVLYAIVYLFNQIMHFGLNISWAKLMTEFLYDIRSAIFSKTLSMKGRRLTDVYSGDIISRMNDDTGKFMNLIHWNVFYNVGGILNLALSVGFIWRINMWVAIFTIAFTPIIVYTSRYFSKQAKKFYSDISKNNGLLSSWLFEIIKGMQDIRLLNASRNIISDYIGRTIKINRLQIETGKIEVLSERVNAGISLTAQLVLYGLSAVFIYNGKMTVGGFTACISYFSTCISSFSVLNTRLVNISSDMVSIERVMAVMECESEEYNDDKVAIEIKDGAVKFTDVYFSYNKEKPVLKGMTLEIVSGDRVSLVGQSGAGKTTIANILCKFYDTDGGTVVVDGIDINDFNLHNLRSQIGIVHQESVFYDGSVRYNLSFSNNKANDEQLWQALKMAHLYSFINELPNGLDTVIGSEGISFSGGQRQRLAIARIFYKNPKILIFDEATSSLDSEAETIIKSSWDEICRGRTILIIAHRLATIINSDKVAVLEDGRIVGFDSHDELMRSCPVYVRLFREQYRNSEVTGNA